MRRSASHGTARTEGPSRTAGANEFLPIVQAKLRIGAPNDRYEQEADRVATQVMRMTSGQGGRTIAPRFSTGEHVQRACAVCEEELRRKPANQNETDLLQTKASPGPTPDLSPEVASGIQTIRTGGAPLPDSARQFFEPRFGHDFTDVRIHTDTRAAESARAVNAL